MLGLTRLRKRTADKKDVVIGKGNAGRFKLDDYQGLDLNPISAGAPTRLQRSSSSRASAQPAAPTPKRPPPSASSTSTYEAPTSTGGTVGTGTGGSGARGSGGRGASAGVTASVASSSRGAGGGVAASSSSSRGAGGGTVASSSRGAGGGAAASSSRSAAPPPAVLGFYEGFDPLSIFSPENPVGVRSKEWLAYSEVYHARWAMLGALGCIAPEMSRRSSEAPPPLWWQTGLLPWLAPSAATTTLPDPEVEALPDLHPTLAGMPDLGGMPIPSLALVPPLLLLFFMHFIELARLQEYLEPGILEAKDLGGVQRYLPTGPSTDPCYPGGIFNLFDFVSSSSGVEEYQARELQVGRVAMVACVGYAVQAMATGVSPGANLEYHLADPLGHNVAADLLRQLGPAS